MAFPIHLRGHSFLVGWAAVLLLTTIACGAAATSTPSAIGTGVTLIPTPRPKEVIIFSDLNWPSAQLQNRIAMFIVEQGYGYPVETISGDSIALFNALIKGDTQVTMEAWLPNQREAWDKALAEGSVIPVGRSLDDNWESAFVVPQYLLDEHPRLRSVQDLREFKDLFATADSHGKARLINCVAGWSCEEINRKKVKAYGLEDVVELVQPESAQALFRSLETAYQKGDPWLGYTWGPTKTAADLDLAVLEEGDCAVGQKPEEGCAYPTARILVAVHPSLISRAPEVVEFLRRWEFAAESQVAVEGWMAENEATAHEGAIWFLNNDPVWREWVPPDVAERVKEALDAGG